MPQDAERDEHAAASRRLEEACDFRGAAIEALLSADPRRGALLAALSGDEKLAALAVEQIVFALTSDEARRAAADLAARGFGRQAGALFALLGAHLDAGEAFAAVGDAVRAARSLELAGRPADGARALEAALRVRPGDATCRLELGRLLARHSRTEAAVKTLQQLDPASPERVQSLPLLRRCLVEIGLEEAARTLRDEMDRHGIADVEPTVEEHAPAPTVGQGGALLLGRYETVREVAVTPHARVLEAIDRVTGERVALKLLAGLDHEGGRDAFLRFEREARALAQLRHPHVVPLRAYHPEGPAIVLAWMAGGSVAERLAREPFAPSRAVEITCAVLGALGEAHRLGILHRDVKPTNVLFDDVGAARLSDFGAAHLGDLSTTATAGAIGTFAYMSPEQRLGRAASLASDLYGAGVLLGEILTGKAPGPVTDRLELPPSACHPDLDETHDALLARLLQDDPRKRPSDAFEARRLLQSVRWPERVWTRENRASVRPPSRRAPAPQGARLIAAIDPGDGRDAAPRRHDTWLDRDVLVFPHDEATMLRAAAFARAGHPTLPTVLRLDTAEGTIWISAPRGRALADASRGVSPGQIARLREAISALHTAHGAHGRLDPAHLYWHDGEIVIAYPRELVPLEEAIALDLAALARLAGE